MVTAGGPNLSEGLEPAQSLLPLLIHPLLPLLLLLFSFLTFLQETTGGDGERDTTETSTFLSILPPLSWRGPCGLPLAAMRSYQVDVVMLVKQGEALLGLKLRLLLSLHTLVLKHTATHK